MSAPLKLHDSICEIPRLVESRHADIDVNHQLIVSRSNRGVEASANVQPRTKLHSLFGRKKVSIFANAHARLGSVGLKNEIEGGDQRHGIVITSIRFTLEMPVTRTVFEL